MKTLPTKATHEFYNWFAECSLKILSIDTGRKIIYRGVSDSNAELLPNFLTDKFKKNLSYENSLYSIFKLKATINLKGLSPWEILSTMRHHGIPTRLLDWTGSFGTALYFSIRNLKTPSDTAIWVFNSSKFHGLNGLGDDTFMPIDVLNMRWDYEQYLANPKIVHKKTKVISVLPSHSHNRISAQQSLFTVHFDSTPLNKLPENNKYLVKLTLPKSLFEQARDYCYINDINEFSLFPDMDGLARTLNSQFFPD